MNTYKKKIQNEIVVTAQEEGQKLLRFLQRRTQQTTSIIHKWIRTGQIRINGKRSKPFDIVKKDDEIRIPPFAIPLQAKVSPLFPTFSLSSSPLLGTDLPVIYADKTLIALCKPSGMPVQPGSSLDDSVVDRLRKAFSGSPYIPAPAHRIDRYTSGLVLCGLTHASQQQLHQWFSEENSPLSKEYLVWVEGSWQEKEKEQILEDRLEKKKGEDGKETMHVTKGQGILARSHIEFIEERRLEHPQLPKTASLLRVKLLTGRKHQIRVQLSSRNHPVIGDPKYGGYYHVPMLLHSWKIICPNEKSICASPTWAEPFTIAESDTIFESAEQK